MPASAQLENSRIPRSPSALAQVRERTAGRACLRAGRYVRVSTGAGAAAGLRRLLPPTHPQLLDARLKPISRPELKVGGVAKMCLEDCLILPGCPELLEREIYEIPPL